jgi:hypothetical protein
MALLWPCWEGWRPTPPSFGLGSSMGRDRPGARRAPFRRRTDRERQPDRNPRDHDSRYGETGMALDRPARTGTRRLLQLRLPRKPRRLRHPQRRPDRARMAEDRGWRRGQPRARSRSPRSLARARAIPRSPGRDTAREHRTPLRLHLGIRAASSAGRDKPATRSRAIRIHATVGAADRRTRRGDQLLDEPKDASRNQEPGRTYHPSIRRRRSRPRLRTSRRCGS